MQIYLDVSCLNRPFDDQGQARVRLESEAILLILQRIDDGHWHQVSSEVASWEIAAIADDHRRARVQLLLPAGEECGTLSEKEFRRATALEGLGFKPVDALHLAAAESLGADLLLSCDDRLCRAARRHRLKLSVHVANPLEWLKEIGNAKNN